MCEIAADVFFLMIKSTACSDVSRDDNLVEARRHSGIQKINILFVWT